MERLHRHLRADGHESLIAHAGRPYGYAGEVDLGRGTFGRAADKAWRLASESMGGPSIWRPSWPAQGRRVETLHPDLVHVHWTYGTSGISLSWVCELSCRMPVVWTMHDMWAITGGCTNPQGCERWRSGCGSCPQIADSPSMEKTTDFDRDVTASLWHRKRRAIEHARLSVVVPSEWLRSRLESSGWVAHRYIERVWNVVDTDVFAPRDRSSARAALGIKPDALVILFVGKPGDVTAYRGRHPIMLDALSRLYGTLAPEQASRLLVLLVGAGGTALAERMGAIRSVCAGRVDGEEAMSRCFAASDVYLNTTQYDNSPAIVQESLSCGIPVVASAVGGIPEMVVHGETGLLAQPQDIAGFAGHLRDLLLDREFRGRLAATARQLAQERFSPESVLPAILHVYHTRVAAHQSMHSEHAR